MAPHDHKDQPNSNRRLFNNEDMTDTESEADDYDDSESGQSDSDLSEAEGSDDEPNQNNASNELREENERLRRQLAVDEAKLVEAQQKLEFIRRLVEEKEKEKEELLKRREMREIEEDHQQDN